VTLCEIQVWFAAAAAVNDDDDDNTDNEDVLDRPWLANLSECL
jgi:hypothetical protein